MKPIKLESDMYYGGIHKAVNCINAQQVSKYLIHIQQIDRDVHVIFGFETYEEYLDYCSKVRIQPMTPEKFGE